MNLAKGDLDPPDPLSRSVHVYDADLLVAFALLCKKKKKKKKKDNI